MKDPTQAIDDFCRAAMRTHAKQVLAYRTGKSFSLAGFLMGAVLRLGRGTLNPETVRSRIEALIKDPAEPREAAEVLAMRAYDLWSDLLPQFVAGSAGAPRVSWGELPTKYRLWMIHVVKELVDREMIKI